jgi:hypothetical protein
MLAHRDDRPTEEYPEDCDDEGEAEAVKAAWGEVQFDSPSEAEAARAAPEDPTTPLEVTHGLRVRITEVVETKEY